MAAAWHRSHASRVPQSHARGRATYTARTVNGSGIASALRCPEVQYTMRVFTDPGGRPRRTAFHAVPAPAVIPLNTCNTGGRESVREIRNVPQASTDKTKARFNFHYWQSQPSQTSATRPARGPCRVRPTRNPSTERTRHPHRGVLARQRRATAVTPRQRVVCLCRRPCVPTDRCRCPVPRPRAVCYMPSGKRYYRLAAPVVMRACLPFRLTRPDAALCEARFAPRKRAVGTTLDGPSPDRI